MYLDNFLSKKNYKTITKIFSKLKGNIPVRWAETDYRNHIFLTEAAKTYDFKKYKGFEEWSQNNTQCNPHVDKDEGYYQKTGKSKYPKSPAVLAVVTSVEDDKNLEEVTGRLP